MKRLTKSSSNRVMSGVLGGMGEYFNIDPIIVRILYVIFSIATAFWGGIVLYIIGMVIIPDGDREWKSDQTVPRENHVDGEWSEGSSKSTRDWMSSSSSGSRNGGIIVGIVFILIGGVFLLNNVLNVNIVHYVMKYREYFWGTILVGIGLLLILLGGKRK